MDITVIDEQKKVELDSKLLETMEQVGIKALSEAGTMDNYEVSVLVTDNEGIRKLNKQYRNKDIETDVLSFPLFEESDDSEEPLFFNETEEIVLGDIVISAEKAKEQSEDFGHSFVREMSYLLVHGILHLLGFSHDDEEEKANMREMEEKILLKLDLGRE
ncbi:MAG: rRNA maturation RNase YbeY [Fusobacteria bacterium]|nr:rRNA maturation RNase YbeY [Fusobacteriota bacterium]